MSSTARLHAQLNPSRRASAPENVDIPVPMVVAQPKVTAQDFQEAIDQSKTMTSAPVTLTGKTKSWTLTTQDISRLHGLPFGDAERHLHPDPVYLARQDEGLLRDSPTDVATKPKDATFDSDGKKAWVVPAVPGEALDAEPPPRPSPTQPSRPRAARPRWR